AFAWRSVSRGQNGKRVFQIVAKCSQVGLGRTALADRELVPIAIIGFTRRTDTTEPVPGARNRETLFVEKLADAAHQQHLVMLVVTPIAAPLHRLELRELLLPVPENVRLHAAQLADFAD